MINILFSGDLAPVGRIERFCLDNKAERIFCGIKHILQETDLHITNLECPLTYGEHQIQKTGPHLKADPQCIRILKEGRVGIACLANNHLRDYADKGIKDTIEVCQRAGIDVVGGGLNSKDAGKVLYKDINDTRLAFINCCENEFSIAEEYLPGANPIEPITLYYDIKDAKEKADLIFVIIHGGAELYQLPTPRLRGIFRFCADLGADAVVGHHSHVFSGYEEYNSKHLVYGLGNFLFDDETAMDKNWNLGLLAKFVIDRKKIVSMKLIPIEQFKSILGVKDLEGEELATVKERIEGLSEIINNDEAFFLEWDKLIENKGRSYLISMMDIKVWDRLLYKMKIKTWDQKRIQKYIGRTYNIVKCQTIRDIVTGFMKKKYRQFK